MAEQSEAAKQSGTAAQSEVGERAAADEAGRVEHRRIKVLVVAVQNAVPRNQLGTATSSARTARTRIMNRWAL